MPADRIRIDQKRPMRDVIIEALQKRGPGPYAPKVEERIKILNARPNARQD